MLDKKSDTSLTVDALRAFAAQAVCVGHAINFADIGFKTYLPHVGVMLFFIISGFVIAFTLDSKSASPEYGILRFGVERFSRIYTAYLPALVLIAVADHLALSAGIPLSVTSLQWNVFTGNLFMLQGVPSNIGTSTYGSAGQLTSVAVEFHIYFFVGALYFFFKGRRRFACLAIALIFSVMPLGYFYGWEGTDRGLFILWLLGFASYYLCSAVKIDRELALISLFAVPLLVIYWSLHVTAGSEYDVVNYPVFAFIFLFVIIASSRSCFFEKHLVLNRLIRGFANCSFSLFLTHLTLVKILLATLPGEKWVNIVSSIVIANIFAFGFYLLFEKHYRQVATALSSMLATVDRKIASLRPVK